MYIDSYFIDETIKIAKRSSLYKFKTGAMIVKDDEIVSRGWSHRSETIRHSYLTVHAELHAVMRGIREDIDGGTIYVVTMSRVGNITSARPCSECARLLKDSGVTDVIYSHRDGFRHIDLNDKLQFKETRTAICH